MPIDASSISGYLPHQCQRAHVTWHRDGQRHTATLILEKARRRYQVLSCHPENAYPAHVLPPTSGTIAILSIDNVHPCVYDAAAKRYQDLPAAEAPPPGAPNAWHVDTPGVPDLPLIRILRARGGIEGELQNLPSALLVLAELAAQQLAWLSLAGSYATLEHVNDTLVVPPELPHQLIHRVITGRTGRGPLHHLVQEYIQPSLPMSVEVDEPQLGEVQQVELRQWDGTDVADEVASRLTCDARVALLAAIIQRANESRHISPVPQGYPPPEHDFPRLACQDRCRRCATQTSESPIVRGACGCYYHELCAAELLDATVGPRTCPDCEGHLWFYHVDESIPSFSAGAIVHMAHQSGDLDLLRTLLLEKHTGTNSLICEVMDAAARELAQDPVVTTMLARVRPDQLRAFSSYFASLVSSTGDRAWSRAQPNLRSVAARLFPETAAGSPEMPPCQVNLHLKALEIVIRRARELAPEAAPLPEGVATSLCPASPACCDSQHAEVVLLECGHAIHRKCMAGHSSSSARPGDRLGPAWNSECPLCQTTAWPVPYAPEVPIHVAAFERKVLKQLRAVLPRTVRQPQGAGILMSDLAEQAAAGLARDQLAAWVAQFEPKNGAAQIPDGFIFSLTQAAMLSPAGRLDDLRALIHHFVLPHTGGRTAVDPNDLIDLINFRVDKQFVTLMEVITQRARALTNQAAVPEGTPMPAGQRSLTCGAALRCNDGKGLVVQGGFCDHLYHADCAKRLIAGRDPSQSLRCSDASCGKPLWFRSPTSSPGARAQRRTPTASPEACAQQRTPAARTKRRKDVQCDCGRSSAIAAGKDPRGRHAAICAISIAAGSTKRTRSSVAGSTPSGSQKASPHDSGTSAAADEDAAASSETAAQPAPCPPAPPPDPGDMDDDDPTDVTPARPGATVPLTLNLEHLGITYDDLESWGMLKTLEFIPPSALVAVTDVVSRILKDCRAPLTSTRYKHAMILFAAFPKLVLGALPPDHTESTKAAVLRRLHLVVHDAGRTELVDEVNKALERLRGRLDDPAARVPTTVPKLNEVRFDSTGMLTCTDDPKAPDDAPPQVTASQLKHADKQISMGRISRGIKALNQSAVAPATDTNIRVMRGLHPTDGLPTPETRNAPAPAADIDMTKTQMTKILHSFPRGTSGGMSGWTPELLLALCRVGLGDFAKNFTALLLDIAKGNVHGEHRRFIFSAKAIAHYKETPPEHQDPSLRPISIGELIRRAAGKHVLKLSEKQAGAYLIARGQVAIGRKGGAEALIHACTATVTAYRTDPAYEDRVYLQADRRNAFNLVSRDKFLQVCKKHAPEAYPYALAAYGDRTYVHYADVAINSESGSQQGCPLGMLLFCLAAADADDQIAKELLEALELKCDYADDQQMAGTLEAVAAFHEAQKKVAAEYGFEYNKAKYRVSCHPHRKAEVLARLGLDESNWVPFEQLQVLGTPIGNPDEVGAAIGKLVDQAKKKFKKFTLLPNKHRAATALHYGATSLMTHFMRTCRTPQSLIQELDDALLETAATIHEVPADEKHKTRLAMGYKEGGFGYRVSAPYTDIAYAASVSETISLAKQLTKIDLGLLPTASAADSAITAAGTNKKLAEDIKARSSSSTSSDKRGLQKQWSKALDEVNKETRLAAAGITQDREQRARTASVADSWHSNHPIPRADGLVPAEKCWHDDVTFTMTTKWRMGDPIYNGHGTCGFCGNLVRDPLGEHVSKCMSKGKRSILHTAIRDIMFRAAAVGGCHPVLEDACFPQTDPTARLDIVCHNMADDKGAPAIDVAVTADYSRVPVTSEVDLPGFIATRYEDKKWMRYGKSVTNCPQRLRITHKPGEKPIALVPFVIDAYGALGQSAKKFLPRIARAIATRLHARPQMIQESIVQQLQLTVQRHIADMFRTADTSPRTIA